MAKDTFRYGNRLTIEVPNGAVRAVVRWRHTYSVPEGSDETRTITLEGKELCEAVMSDYRALIGFLSPIFGEEIIACSYWPRAILTAFLITESPQIHTRKDLQSGASIKKSPAPAGSAHNNLYEHWKTEGTSLGEMLRRLAADPNLFGDQPVERALAMNETFLREAFPDCNLVVTFDHEPIISLLAAKHGAPAEMLGLEECQAMVFFLDRNRNVLSVQKFTSSATLPQEDPTDMPTVQNVPVGNK